MHPGFYLVAEFVTAVLVIGFTPADSNLRLWGLAWNIFCVFKCIPLCMQYMVRTPWGALLGGFAISYLYHYLDIALLSRWSFEHRAPVSGLVKPSAVISKRSQVDPVPNSKSVLQQRLLFGLSVGSTFRFIGTPYEVQSVPPARATTRKGYFRRTYAVVLVSYIVLDFINSINDPEIASKFLGLKNVPLFTRLHEVSAEELIIRLFTVLAAGISLNCVQGGIYHLIGLFAVSFGISAPTAWPPFYGSPREAYTLRRFWNIFWHQTNARKYSSVSHFIVHRCLKLRRGTISARYLRVLAAFFASGFMHLINDLASGITIRDSGALNFFSAQALGLVIEDCFMGFYRRLPQGAKAPRVLEKTIGYVWVSLFLAWSVPAYLYPMMWRSSLGLNDSTIPFSVFGSGSERAQAITGLLAIGAVSGSAVLLTGDSS